MGLRMSEKVGYLRRYSTFLFGSHNLDFSYPLASSAGLRHTSSFAIATNVPAATSSGSRQPL
jgi:hypothetical protein